MDAPRNARASSELSAGRYLFHADDDSIVPLADNQAFADAMRGAGKKITFKRVASGDHYDSMIAQGIPAGIEFMKSQGARPVALSGAI